MRQEPEKPSDELNGLVEKFSVRADAIVDGHSKPLGATPPPPLIYHYTSDTGLKGILESGKFWFSDIFSLNDPSELRHGVMNAIKLVRAAAQDGSPEFKMFAEDFVAILNGSVEAVAHFFVCCFSQRGDELGQWRAYADNGRGYSLGFDAHLLEQAFGKAGEEHFTFPVTYNDTRLRELQGQLVGEIRPLVSAPRGKGLSGDAIAEYMKRLSVQLALHGVHIAVYFKHEAYRNEEEYRFLQMLRADQPVVGLKYRSRPYSLIRYREFDWRSVAAGALKEILVGPAADKRVAGQFVSDCLRAYHPVGGVALKASDVPYRSG